MAVVVRGIVGMGAGGRGWVGRAVRFTLDSESEH